VSSQAETTIAPTSAPRWSAQHPASAALLYVAAYLLVAAAGGAVAARVAADALALTIVVTVVGTIAMALSLLLVLSICRIGLCPRVEGLLLVPLTLAFLLLRPEVTRALALRFHPALLHWLPRPSDSPLQNLLGNVVLIVWAVFIGRLVSHVIREGKLLLPVAVAASLTDIVTVFWGFVGQAAQQAPQLVQAFSAQAPLAKAAERVPAVILTSIGIGDFLFLGVFLAVALRHSMDAAKTIWAAFAAMLVAAVVLAMWRGDLGIPGLPFISVGVLLVNRRHLTFAPEEKRALAIAGLLLAALAAIAVVLLVARHR
jgi:hypothetical protein